MKLFTLVSAILATCASVAQAQEELCTLVECTQNALGFAYLYGYGIYAARRFILTNPNATTNSFAHQRALATPGSIGVVRPNADTVYSAMFGDLSSNDLVITIPEIVDRYWVFPFYDLYGDNLANIGSLTGHPAGDYLVTYTPNEYGVENDDTGDYAGIIKVSVPYTLSVIRVLVGEAEDDIEEVRVIQDGFSLQTIPRAEPTSVPAWDLSIFRDPALNDTSAVPEAVMNLTAKLGPYQESIVPQDRTWINRTLRSAGMAAGTWTPPPSTDLEDAVARANAAVASIQTLPGYVVQLGQNWTMPGVMGLYGPYYQIRYWIAQLGYLALTADQAIYPFFPSVTLAEGESALFTFGGGNPAIREGGFWSMTAYNAQGFLVENELNRYSVGDRSNLTYADGTPVGGEGDDGSQSFQILLQPADLQPPGNWSANWLPVPPNGGTFSITLRWYGGETSMIDGSYEYPKLSIIPALTE